MDLAYNLKSRRTQLDLSQKELASRAGVSQQLIHALEAGTTRSTKFINEIASALGCSVSQLDQKYGTSEPPRYGMAEDYGDRVGSGPRLGDLPIFAAAETDRGDVVVPDTPIDFIPRPFPLLNVRGGYGVIVAASFMYPEFEPGDYVLVNPHSPPVANSSCVFYQDSKQGSIVRIRRLTKFTPDEWHVSAWNPRSKDEETVILPRDTWHQCHRIVGRYFRR
jgi:transcriptional regulator with XRE-family HTH domain